MKIQSINFDSDVILQFHIKEHLFIAGASIVQKRTESVVLRLHDHVQFLKLWEVQKEIAICYKGELGVNFITDPFLIEDLGEDHLFLTVPNDLTLYPVKGRVAHPKFAYNYKMVMTQGVANITVEGFDISAAGLGVYSPKEMLVGDTIYIDVYNFHTKQSRMFRMRVVNCKRLSFTQYKVGLMFTTNDPWILNFVNELQNDHLHTILEGD